MDFYTRIKIKERELVHANQVKGKTIDDLADHLKKSYNYLTRITSITDNNPFPLELLVPAMKFKNNYDLLRFMAIECNGVFVKLPKTKIKKGDENKITAEYQKAASDAISCLLNFLEDPTNISYKKVDEALLKIIEESISVRKFVQKKASNQEELF